ncbi:hypothetical protein Vafri_843, partial [Volvox africanus]
MAAPSYLAHRAAVLPEPILHESAVGCAVAHHCSGCREAEAPKHPRGLQIPTPPLAHPRAASPKCRFEPDSSNASVIVLVAAAWDLNYEDGIAGTRVAARPVAASRSMRVAAAVAAAVVDAWE